MKTVLKIALGVLLASLMLLAGCAVLFGAFVTEVDEGIKKEGARALLAEPKWRRSRKA